EVLARAAGSVAARIAGLRHEAVDHAMEFKPVVEAGACQLLHPRDGIGREIRAKFDHDAARGHIEIKGVFKIGSERGGSEAKDEDGRKREETNHSGHDDPEADNDWATLAEALPWEKPGEPRNRTGQHRAKSEKITEDLRQIKSPDPTSMLIVL